MAKQVQGKVLQALAGVSYTYHKGSLQYFDPAEAERLEAAGIIEIVNKKPDATQGNSTASGGAGNTSRSKGVAKGSGKRRGRPAK